MTQTSPTARNLIALGCVVSAPRHAVPESLTYGRHAITAEMQIQLYQEQDPHWRRHEVIAAVDDWLIAHYRATQVVIVLLGVLTATVIALAATGHLMTAIAVGLVGGLAVAFGIAFEFMGSTK